MINLEKWLLINPSVTFLTFLMLENNSIRAMLSSYKQ